MSECIFCQIAAGTAPAEIVYEDSDVLAFLDIKPVNPGHTLVIPKRHYPNLYETPDDALAKLTTLSKRAAQALKDSGLADGTTIQINNDPVAGQVVAHTHLHVIPRLADDGLRLWPQHEYPEGAARAVADKLRAHLR